MAASSQNPRFAIGDKLLKRTWLCDSMSTRRRQRRVDKPLNSTRILSARALHGGA